MRTLQKNRYIETLKLTYHIKMYTLTRKV